MVFWMFFLLMMFVAVMCVLWPMSRGSRRNNDNPNPIDIYKKQLEELQVEAETSVVSSDVFAARKAEISRRILRQFRATPRDHNPESEIRSTTKLAGLGAAVAIPLIAIPMYFFTGAPQFAALPLVADNSEQLSKKSIGEMVLIAERHLAQNPKDVRGWEVLAGVYGRMDRPADRARALQELLKLSDPTPDRLADLGEALTVAAGNIVPVRAREYFEKALVMQADQPKASLYMAVTFQQEGRFAEAMARWQKLSVERGNDPRWNAVIDNNIKLLRSKMAVPSNPGPTEQEVENAAGLSAEDRTAMIETMVARLAARLENNPGDFSGWSRLIRSYKVLDKVVEAKAAMKRAKARFNSQPGRLQELNAMAQQLNINSDGKEETTK